MRYYSPREIYISAAEGNEVALKFVELWLAGANKWHLRRRYIECVLDGANADDFERMVGPFKENFALLTARRAQMAKVIGFEEADRVSAEIMKRRF